MRIYLVLLFFFSLLWGGCHSRSGSVVSIDMSAVKEEVTLKFEDLATDCRLVKLETNPEVLLEGWFRTWVGDKYIVTWGNEEMHLFSAEGKHLRRLSVHGRGPGEFEYISCLTVDEKKDRLYFSDSGKNQPLSVIDLQTGSFAESFELPEARPEEMVLGDDSVLYCVPGYKKAAYELYQVSVSGQFIRGIPNKHAAINLLLNDSYLTIENNNCYYMAMGVDTLYQLSGEAKVPKFCFDGLKPIAGEEGKEHGTAVSLRYWNVQGMLVQLQYFKRMDRKFGDHVFTFDGNPDMCWVSLPAGEVKKVKGLYINELQQSLPDFDLHISEKYICNAVSAMQFREWTKEENVPWHSWYARMTDDDNPVLIIGRK